MKLLSALIHLIDYKQYFKRIKYHLFFKQKLFHYAVFKTLSEFKEVFNDRKDICLVLDTLKEHFEVITNENSKRSLLIEFNLYADFDQYILSPKVLKQYIRNYGVINAIKAKKNADLIISNLKRKLTEEQE